jgi:anti-sigma28 factor (negative regulator of flagellin synthesis)
MRFDDLPRRRAAVAGSRRRPLIPQPSADADWMKRAERVPGVRMERVKAIRDALAAGTYDIDAKVASFVQQCEQGGL